MLKSIFICLSVALVLCVENSSASGRIVGGSLITINQAPYNVQLRYSNSGLFCGGALISEYYVLTAAHCFPDRRIDNLVVVAGATYSSDMGQQSRAAALFIHPEYTPQTMHSDAAIIQLAQPMRGAGISPIKVCSKPVMPGSSIVVTGWGRTSDNGPMSEQLRYVSFPVRTRESCTNEFHMFVKKNMFCGSGLEAKGHCFGDSGGPGVINKEICGINSFGYKCGDVGSQSAFTDVYAVRDFIRKVTNNSVQ